MKTSLFSTISMGFILSLSINASDLMIPSETYFNLYKNHVTYNISNTREIGEMSRSLKEATNNLELLRKKHEDLQSELQQNQRTRIFLLKEIENLEADILELEQRISFLLREYYPRHSSVSSLKNEVENEKQYLELTVSRLNEDLERASSPYNQRIDSISHEIDKMRKVLHDTITNIDTTERDLERYKELVSRQQLIVRQTKNEMDNISVYEQKIEKAKKKVEEADKKRGSKNCRGFSAFSRECARYEKAKEELKEIQERYKRLKSGAELRSVQEKLNYYIKGEKDKSENLEQLKRSEIKLTRALKRNTNELNAIEQDKERATSYIRQRLDSKQRELNTFHLRIQNATRIFDIDSQRMTSVRKVSEFNNQISQLDQRNTIIPTKLQQNSALQEQALTRVERLKDQVQTISKESEEKRQNLLNAEFTYKKLLAESGHIDLMRGVPSFSSEETYSNRDWSLEISEGSRFDERSRTCIAKTKSKNSSGEYGELSIGKILQSHESSEPIIFVKLERSSLNSEQAKTLTLSAPNSNKKFVLNLISSLSSPDNLIFMSEVNQRKELLKVILAEYVIKADVDQTDQSFEFSLRGSTKTILSDRSSLAEVCEGIDIME